MYDRILNFMAGPAAMPLTVLQQIEADLYNYKGTGMSIMETSHRAGHIQEMIDQCADRIKRLMGLSTDFEVIFMQGGGTLQFTAIPTNFSAKGDPVDYVDTGYWTQKAIQEAQIIERDVAVIASSAVKGHSYVPNLKDIPVRSNAKYLHICSNNTVVGTQFNSFPELAVPLIADMSSDFMSKVFPVDRFKCMYAHAQKNVGIAGVTVVIIHKELMKHSPKGIPSIIDYSKHIKANSNYHTPPVFSIYASDLSLKWLETEIGGVENMQEINMQKANLLYDFLDESTFYENRVEVNSRSMMNILFNLPDVKLDQLFIQEALANGIAGVNGHRSIGGCRVSLFNGVSLNAVKQLLEFMFRFEKAHHRRIEKSEEVTFNTAGPVSL